MPTEAFPQRKIGRVDRSMPLVLWRIESASEMIDRCIDYGADWFFIPASVPNEVIAGLSPLLERGRLVIGIEAEHFALRSTQKVDARLASAGRSAVDAVMLQEVSLAEVKEGRTFHRFTQLRDQNRVQLCFVEAATHADAEWLVRHTPAHGVSMIFGLNDPTARYRVFAEAGEIGAAIMACPAITSIWQSAREYSRFSDLSFVASHPQVSTVIEPLPASDEELGIIINAIQHPMPATESDAIWENFQAQIPEPKKLRGAHPPDWA
jgi:hypothetical protein